MPAKSFPIYATIVATISPAKYTTFKLAISAAL
jgi:hypothetical protein